MPLIKSVQKDAITVLNTYKSKSGKNILHVLDSKIPGLPIKRKVVCCNQFDMPYRIKDFTREGVDIYEKAQDGYTMFTSCQGKKYYIKKPFLKVCELLIKK